MPILNAVITTPGLPAFTVYAKKYLLKDGREKESWYWEAHWPTERGESVTVNFSVNEYGEAVAKQLAIRAREQGMKKLEGFFWASERGAVDKSKPSQKAKAKASTSATRKSAANKKTASKKATSKTSTKKATTTNKAAAKKTPAQKKPAAKKTVSKESDNQTSCNKEGCFS